MTEDQFKSSIANLSPNIAATLSGTTGEKISTELGSLAKLATDTSDFQATYDKLKNDPAKLSALEAIVASTARVAARNPVATPAYMWVGPIVSGTVLVGFFMMLYFLLHTSASALESFKNIQNVLFTLLGALGAAFTQVVNYWLGSSKGSADKTNLLASQKPNA